jgi:tyrocidine synthetase-3
MFKEIDEILLSPKYLEQRAYWVNKLSSAVEKTKLPFISVRNRETGKKIEKKIENMEILIPDELFAGLIKLAKGSDLSLYIILLTALKLLIYRYTDNEDVIVVSPVYKPNVTAETLNDRVFIRDSIDGELIFIELLLQIRKTVLEAYENQDYPSGKLIQFLFNKPQIQTGTPDPISDIGCLLLNIHDSKAIEPVRDRLIFSFERKENGLKGRIFYDSSVYERGYVQLVSEHFVEILGNTTLDVKKRLPGIFFSLKEKEKQLVADFNRTRAEYPKEKTLVELFEEQVEKAPGNLAVVFKNSRLTYMELNEKANRLARHLRVKNVKTGTIVGLMMERSLEMLIAIIGALKAGGAFLPIDDEYPEVRKQFILKDSNSRILITQRHIYERKKPTMQYSSAQEIVYADEEDNYADEVANLDVACNPLDPAYVIYTSGTTGKPKGVMISHQAIVNYTWWAVRQYVKNESVDFPLYTSISFDLTMTSIFTPLITGNAIVVYGEGEKSVLVERVIEDDKVGVVKLTPSHLKLIRYKEGQIPSGKLRRFIVGGEELERELALEITRKYNGKIEIYNEYGPTEAAVGCMIYRFDPAEDTGNSVPLGKPAANTQIYILDNRLKPAAPGVPGELCIGGDGLAAGYLNRPELTAEKFLSFSYKSYRSYRTYFSKKIYKTGDLARLLLDGNIEFLGRKDKQVKISGFRIELAEIERLLTKHEKIKEAVVIAGEEGRGIGGKYLCAYIVADIELEIFELREYLSNDLPPYMIPSYFVHLETIPLTLNGKVNEKALPPPGLKSGAEYAAPRNLLEERIVGIWSEVLGIEKDIIGIDANFFEMGGNSLKATILMAKMHKALNIKVLLEELFKTPTIRGLAEIMKVLKEDRFASIEPAEEKEFYILSSAQKRLHVLQQLDPESSAYNMPQVIPLDLKGNTEKERIEDIFKKLISRHESLRTSFRMSSGQSFQTVHQPHELEFEIESISVEQRGESADIIENFVRPFDLSQAPLLRVKLIKTGEDKHLLLLDMHHIITDGISQDILTADFMSLFRGEELTPLRLQYKDYAGWQIIEKRKETMRKQEEFWLKEFEGSIPLLNLPFDYPRPRFQTFESGCLSLQIDNALKEKIMEFVLRTGTTLYNVLLAAYNLLLSKYTGQEDIMVGTVVSGRRHADLENIIGMFVNMLPMRNFPDENKAFREFLEEVRQNALNAFENQDYPFEELVRKLGMQGVHNRNPLFDTVFVLQSHDNEEIERNRVMAVDDTPNELTKRKTPFDLILGATETKDTITLSILYKTALFKLSTLEKMLGHYIEILRNVVEDGEIKHRNIALSYDSLDAQLKAANDEYGNFGF